MVYFRTKLSGIEHSDEPKSGGPLGRVSEGLSEDVRSLVLSCTIEHLEVITTKGLVEPGNVDPLSTRNIPRIGVLTSLEYGNACFIVLPEANRERLADNLLPESERLTAVSAATTSASVDECATESCRLEMAARGMKLLGPVRARKTPEVLFIVLFSPAQNM